jgi:hypothetical protein
MSKFFNAVRKRCSYANVAVTLALVFAMTGGAYAAKRYIITSTKQIKPSVLKQLKGKVGPAGRAGAAGPVGPAGPTGPAGAGTAGAKGETGPQGAEGKQGPQGIQGVEGKQGEKGETGFTETLPSGKTEEGTWSILYHASEAALPGSSAISFPIPLAADVPATFIGAEEGEGEAKENESLLEGKCTGNHEKPGAVKGHLCVFAFSVENAGLYIGITHFLSPEGSGFGIAGKAGIIVAAQSEGEGNVAANGTWAVTAN